MTKHVLVQSLSKSYGTKSVLSKVSFETKAGEIVAFLGPNGAGKSTTIKTLLGLKKYSTGTVTVLGEKPGSWAARQKVGYAAQDISFPAHLKCREVLELVQSHYSSPMDLTEISDKFDLNVLLTRYVGGLSGGEKRRLAVACAVLGRPSLLILDEPTTGLDVEGRILLWRELRNFMSGERSIFLSTHDLNEVSQVADKVIFIDHGQVIYDGSVQNMLKKLPFKKIKFSSLGNPPELPNLQTLNGRHHVLSYDSDQLIRDLVVQKVAFQDLEIEPATLEEVFIYLRKNVSHEVV